MSAISTGQFIAYEKYSESRDATNCRACHGNFRANDYVSMVDGQTWADLHELHQGILNEDCFVCHQSSLFPVQITRSLGGDGAIEPYACMGCHGRLEDGPITPSVRDCTEANPCVDGPGAAMRQRHFRAGETECAACHTDSNPANFVPVGESALPEYYKNPGDPFHPNIPKDPCNADGSENFAGDPIGIDNDGDGDYDATLGDAQNWDTTDPDCACLTDSLIFSVRSQSDFTWQPPASDACPVLFDVAKGNLSDPRATGAFGAASCFENNDTDLQASDAATPSSTDGFYYLSRVEGDSWDTGTESTSRDSSLTVCSTP
ncbi:MAG: cytochrome c3 family protein [Acidobacteriota bacterium]|nr:MAG: cytochrome c3 family protein [Acidobacteriota bacterium]